MQRALLLLCLCLIFATAGNIFGFRYCLDFVLDSPALVWNVDQNFECLPNGKTPANASFTGAAPLLSNFGIVVDFSIDLKNANCSLGSQFSMFIFRFNFDVFFVIFLALKPKIL